MAAASSRPGKRPASLIREANPFGWFSDDDKRTDFIYQWGFKEVIRHKRLNIVFFRSEGFLFQEWLVKSSLTKFLELKGDCYPTLVKIPTWRTETHHGVPRLNKVDIYNNFLKDPNMIRKYDSFSTDHLTKEERMCAYVITWILLPTSEDQSLLNAEDVYLLYALQTNIHLPYVVFISRILRLQNVDIKNEITIGDNKKKVIEKLFLEHSGLRKRKEGWIFKDKVCPETDKVDPVNIDMSKYEFRPQTKFGEFVEVRFKRLDEKMPMLQKSFTKLHKKMDYSLRINAFGDTSVDDSESEKNSAYEKIVEPSETE
ncbi:hypothetical protein LR48_Vigan07g175200 [Vigna angularis]|uniref:Uncharacterized protein n=1 Tax=Phaseolus angularis TaxID=3914 RepID=A0A0L9UZ53_PHAAN|nr:hypothetical protein LR48_Vigan07g175200 [Vigna angularis]